MEKIPLQNALEQARANPNSQFATQLRQAIQSGKLDDAAQKQGVDLTKYGRPKVEQGYFQRVGEGIKQSFQEAGKDITTQDNRPSLSKGISAVSNIATAAAKPITEAPVIKQIGEGINKGINFTGEQLAKIYSPEFQASLANMSDEEFAVATQPLQDLANAGNIANTLLMAKGGQKGTSIAKDTVGKASEIAQKSKELIKDKTAIVGDVIKDITPTKETLRDRAVAKALRLSPVEDLAVIEQSTGGNKIGEYLDKYELIGKNAPSTAENIAKFKKKNLNMVNDAISLVDDKFTFADIPELKTTVDFLIKDLSGRKSPEYQQILGRLNAMKNKDNFQLLDAQYVKNVFDDVESIYKRTGETRDALAAQDKAQTIAPVRRFIEERVKEKYPEIDIQSLNNNVRTTSAILDAIVKRAPKNTTASIFGLGDFATVGIGNQILPGAGFPALFGKKVIESAPIQLRFAKYLAGKTKDVTKGMSLEQIKQADQFIRSELESSIKDLDEVSIQKLRDAQKQIEKKLKNKNQTTKSSLKDLGETPSTNLINEAKKYKSAEEFVKAQPKLYHGGSADIKDIQLGKSNFQKTFYMSENPEYAKSYGGNKSSLNEIVVDSKAKLADLRKPSDDLVKQIEDLISQKPTGKTVRIQKPDGTFLEIPETKGGLSNSVHSSKDILNGIRQGKAYFAEMPEVKKALKKLGYDGMITQESKMGANFGVWNKDILKTKSQLEEIWKKANKKPAKRQK